MQPWKRIALTEDQLQIIYREWGVFYTHKQKLDIAAEYYDVSLNLKNDPKAYYHRSRCKRSIAQTDGALVDGKAAMASDPYNQPYNLNFCDTLYELNQLEDTKCELFNNSLKFQGLKLRAFHHRQDILDRDFDSTLGDTLGPFILEHERYIHLALDALNEEKFVDTRPLWKILREMDRCDVLSVLEKEELLLSPREIARRMRAFNIFNQIYMRRSWIDVLFLRALRKDPNLLLPQSQWSRPQIEQITKNKYTATVKFIKMLHARCPLYTKKVRKCPNKELAEKHIQAYLFRVQYQVHRNMLAMLKKVKLLRKTGKIGKLKAYIETFMGDYVVLKTRRVMPWKFEFINEVYNLLALALIDRYTLVPKNLLNFSQHERLLMLLKLPYDKEKEPLTFIFGDKSSYVDEEADDLPMIRQRAYLSRLEKRIIFTKYPIERAYLWHEIAEAHLKTSRFDECCIMSRRAIDEARKCNSFAWTLLGYLVTCKSHAVLKKVEKINDTLVDAMDVALRLNDNRVNLYIELLQTVNEQDTHDKKNQDELRRTKSRTSVSSHTKSFSDNV